MTKPCSYPSCRAPATHTWALVPVCWRHRERIMEETLKYYWLRGRTKRPEYEKIRQYTPWRGDGGVKWISIRERLPEKEGYYLAYSYGNYEITKFKKGKFYIWEQDTFENLDWYPTTLITHWMPLPEPPEGEHESPV